MAATTKKRMQTLEEVWATVSSAIGRDLNGSNAKPLRLTPRSAAACIKHGVTPELLKIRPLESFTNRPGAVPDDVARIRHEAYTQRRYDYMRLVRADRDRMVAAEALLEAQAAAAGPKENAGAAAAKAKGDAATATMVKREVHRMQKMRQRQAKEIESMLTFQKKAGELAAEQERRNAVEKAREDKRKREREERAERLKQEQREREVLKKAEEDRLERERQRKAVEDFEHEAALEAKRQKELRRQAQLAVKAARARDEKLAAQAAKTQAIIDAQERATRRKMEEMEGAERERVARVEERNAVAREEKRRVRALAEARVLRNFELAANATARRKVDIMRKDQQHEEVRQIHLDLQQQDAAMAQSQRQLQAERRKLAKEAVRHEEMAHATKLVETFAEQAARVQEARGARLARLEMQKERSNLRQQLKLENVQRMRRVHEAARLEAVAAIEGEKQRLADIDAQKLAVTRMRTKASITARVERDELREVMEKAPRMDPEKAAKLVAEVVLGKTAPKKAKTQRARPPSPGTASVSM